MHLVHALILGLVQGLTEFLPISSTAHLTVAEYLLLGQRLPLAFDILLHTGTLLALSVFFRKELKEIFQGLAGRHEEGRRLATLLGIAMVPTLILGFLTRPLKEMQKEYLWAYGIFLILNAGMLWAASGVSKRRAGRDFESVSALDAALVGSIQGLAGGLGLSRSGSTISIGIFRSLSVPAATRFSFLLGIPTIAAATLSEGMKLALPILKGQPLPAEIAFPAASGHPALLCLIGVAAAALSGYATIGFLERLTRTLHLDRFAAYCLVAGAAVLVFVLHGA